MRTIFKRAAAGLAAMCLTLLALSIPTEAGRERGTYNFNGEVVGYYAGWSAYQGFTPDQIPAEELTQINYAFAQIDPDSGTILLEDAAQDKKNLAALRKLRTRNPQLKLLISVGGWSDSKYFSDVASTKARRETFAASCAAFVSEYGLDGVDLDWEYPVSGGAPGTIHRPADKENFTLLLQELRSQLDRQGRRDGKTYSLTIAGAAGAWYLNQIEAVKVADIVDHIFLMGYDLHGTWDTYADLNAPLYTPSAASLQSKTSISSCVQSYLNKGIPAEKIVLGMPLYGYAYQGVSSKNNGLYSTYTSARSVSYKTIKNSYLNQSTYRQLRHEEAQVPYLYGKNTFISYDDVTSITAKAELAWSLGLGGIGFWEISQDDGGELISAAGAVMRNTWDNPFRDVKSDAWYEDAVRYVYENGMMQGTSATTFSPAAASSRGMIAAILHRLEGSPKAGTTPFSDVEPDAYCADAAAWAAKEGIIQGYEDGTFRPGAPITRQQLAAMLFRYAVWMGEEGTGRADLSGYQDSHLVEPYAQEAMEWAVDTGLLQGRADGRLDPGGYATRAQLAVILQRFCNSVGKG